VASRAETRSGSLSPRPLPSRCKGRGSGPMSSSHGEPDVLVVRSSPPAAAAWTESQPGPEGGCGLCSSPLSGSRSFGPAVLGVPRPSPPGESAGSGRGECRRRSDRAGVEQEPRQPAVRSSERGLGSVHSSRNGTNRGKCPCAGVVVGNDVRSAPVRRGAGVPSPRPPRESSGDGMSASECCGCRSGEWCELRG
jgi:hypothetical protein